MNKESLLEEANELNIPRQNCMKTKEELRKSHQRHHHKVQADYFWCRYPCLYDMLRGASKAASHR